ncbi:MAG: hypothetical protein HQ519_11795 [Planctomycetes bacterium]|nr:hypothetical protein [Planctomycetota bacterium]
MLHTFRRKENRFRRWTILAFMLFFSHLYVEKFIEPRVADTAHKERVYSNLKSGALRLNAKLKFMESWVVPLSVGLSEATLEFDRQIAIWRNFLLQATGGSTQQMHEVVLNQLNELDHWSQGLAPKLFPVETPSAELSAMKSKLMTSDWLATDGSTLAANHRRLHQFLDYVETVKSEWVGSNLERINAMEVFRSEAREEMDVIIDRLWYFEFVEDAVKKA